MNFVNFISENYILILQSFMVHLKLVAISVGIGFFVSVPIGIVLSRHQNIAKYVMAFAGVIQTIPGLVLLGFSLIIFGIGMLPAIVVLTLYSILPMLRNTYTGIVEVDQSYIEAARGIGMSNMQILFKVELPLALSSIIGGLRLSTVYIISWATLAGLIGAGGLGDLIWTGLATYENNFILAGAVPSAIMAIVFGALIGFVQNLLTPRGLKQGGR